VNDKEKDSLGASPLDISDDDVLEAMKSINGHLDITPGDFKETYRVAFRHAMKRLAFSRRAKDIMVRSVVSISTQSPIAEAAEKMAINGISGLPVIDIQEKVTGVISEKDFLFHMGSKHARSFMEVITQCLQNKGCLAISIRERFVEEIMTSPAITVNGGATVAEMAGIFKKAKINRLPVIDTDGRLIGLVTRTDILNSTGVRAS